MILTLPTTGAASAALVATIQDTWLDGAARCGLKLDGLDPESPLAERLAWAKSCGLSIGTILSRYSTKLQHSTIEQVHECVTYAAAHGIYVPPELVCVDEGISGRKARRAGLDRVQQILTEKIATVLLVYKVSRLFRVAYKGFQFFNEHVVEEGLRAISVSQGIDTRDEKSWKQLAYLHGIMDEMLLTTIADHVRSGLTSLFREGYVTGAITVGYDAVDAPNAPLTKQGKPRRVPQPNPVVAAMIRQHYEWIRDGMTIQEGWRRWVAAGGAYDRRSPHQQMSYQAYRAMLSNQRYLGVWAFGRRRNQWSSKRDYTRQVEQPETEVLVVQHEELRILSDELFHAVQSVLAQHQLGPRGPKRQREHHLWDYVTDCFYCGVCSTPDKLIRFYQAGAHGHSMRCKRGPLCPARTLIRRKEAVQSVCEWAQQRLQNDSEFLAALMTQVEAASTDVEPQREQEIKRLENDLRKSQRRIDSLLRLAGDLTGTDADELEREAKKALAERHTLRQQHAQLVAAKTAPAVALSPEQVRQAVANLTCLLEAAASGQLGTTEIYRAAAIFRLLVGDRIVVHSEPRPERQWANVYGTFTPQLLATLRRELNDGSTPAPPSEEIRVWLRPPPQRDQLAERVHQLIENEGLSFRAVAKQLNAEGIAGNSGVVWQIYQRYYEMRGETPPTRPYNNGQRRAPRRA